MRAVNLPGARPHVSVLMPTFKQAAFIRRALESLRAQTFQDWEAVIVDDGSPDETEAVVAPYLSDPRFRYTHLAHNQGLGAALNMATSLARGQYLAYLPSDDIYYPEHLARLAQLLDSQAAVYLAYGGVCWGDTWHEAREPTLQGAAVVGHEHAALAAPIFAPPAFPLTNNNILALVQVMHRRDEELDRPWPTQAAIVSDTLEPDYWRGLLECGAQFAYAGEVTCAWVSHPDQRHKIICTGGLPRYRSHYAIDREVLLNFLPTTGMRVNEPARFGQFTLRHALPDPGGLKILLVGALGYNEERIVALEERGNKLYGLWMNPCPAWDATGPFSFGNIETISYDRDWPQRVAALKPDLIYALLNNNVQTLIGEVLDAGLDLPLVYHHKDGPFWCYADGTWPIVERVLRESDGQIFISPENFEWFQLTMDGLLDPATMLILDGDLPKIECMTDDWTPKLSAQDGAIHTVCPGRPIGITDWNALAEARIHVHLYGNYSGGRYRCHTEFGAQIDAGLQSGMLHLHPEIESPDWVRELSRYDAGWCHIFEAHNAGDLHRATWDEINLPARLATYAAAGLPWIMKDNSPHLVTTQRIARDYDVGICFKNIADLAEQLRDRRRMAQLTANMRASRYEFAFDTHVDDLIAFFRAAIKRHQAKAQQAPVSAFAFSET